MVCSVEVLWSQGSRFMSEPSEAKQVQESAGGHRRQRTGRWKFRVAAIVVALLIFPALEVVFRIFSIGRNVNVLVNVSDEYAQQNSGWTHQLNGLADLAYFGRADLAGPEVRPFVLPKPEGNYRVVVLGGSTVIGFPYAPELAFPRHIEMQLRQQSPEIVFEVLNLGITSMNSFAVNDLASQCLAMQPDLVVLHTGHNEFYGPGGPASNAFSLSPELIRMVYRMRRWQTVQFATSTIAPDEPLTDDLLDVLPARLQIPADDPVFTAAAGNYESNLREVLSTCTAAGVPVLLTSVACNLSDQGPLLADWPNHSVDGKLEWENLMQSANQCLTAGEYESALEQLMAAAEIAQGHAEVHYRIGQCYQGLERTQDAWDAFERARDLDGCRFRAPSEFSKIAESVAAEFDECTFLNTYAAFRSEGYLNPPGFDLFLEHVHYNFQGHYVLGKVYARTIQERFRGELWQEAISPDLEAADTMMGLLTEDELAATSFALQVLQTGPFRNAVDHDGHVSFLSERAAHMFTELGDLRGSVFADLPMDQMSDRLLSSLHFQHSKAGNAEFCGQLEKYQRIRRPWEASLPQ